MSSYQSGGGDVPSVGILLNVDFTGATPSDKSGYAAYGITEADFWNAFLPAQGATVMALKWSDGTDSVVTIQSTGAIGGVILNNGNTDPMVASFLQNGNPGHEKTFSIAGLTDGTYDLYLYGYGIEAGPAVNRYGQFLVLIDGVQYPNPTSFFFTTTNVNPPPWTNGGNFVKIPNIPIVEGQILQIKAFYEGGVRFGKISGLQLVKSPPTDDPTSVVEPDIFSNTKSYFFDGDNQTSGTYRVTYLNGAMGYDGFFKWMVNLDSMQKFLVGHSGGVELTGPWQATQTPTQAEIEEELGGNFIDFVHTGGPIYMYLQDAVYGDNVAGSPNPRFSLQRIA